ncbi:bromodomain adjacent to zinc finger domain protein 1A-like [Anopheles nili]|uniref:bromodomain adjacent to zinc finger domain protein 1A-like n=1 Tax=Anopheles nili TaxID=185578 RepID=UPI00237A4666|nr:bromodomain adjacent to zinc finger domain protein 1A-like [Anopheles nili]
MSDPEPLKDNDEVFVCEQTQEIFSTYDDYFNRIMLLSSTSWSCEMTGRTNLTYEDALASEADARKTLRKFPTVLKGPILLVASRTKRTAIRDLAGDVFGYVKDVFFKGETIVTKSGETETPRKAKITRVAVADTSNGQQESRLTYHVAANDNQSPEMYSVHGNMVMRERNVLTREKCKLFLKQHVELGPDQMLCIKKKSLIYFVTSKGWTEENVFYGRVPTFTESKKRNYGKATEKSSTKANATKKKNNPPDAKNLANKPVKKQDLVNGASKNKNTSNKKQQSIAKYLQQPSEDKEALRARLEAENKTQVKKAEQIALVKKKNEEIKALLLQQVTRALKQYSAVKEDQELTDQRVLPPLHPVCSQIGGAHFSNFMFILEFLSTFGDLISLETRFPEGVTMDLLERALLHREVNGPLSDILQVLLCAIFEQQIEEQEEQTNENSGKHYVSGWCFKYLSTKLTDLPMDSATITELLRLHFLASVQPNQSDDPCFQVLRYHPNITRVLTLGTVYHLSVSSVILLISALIHQLLVSSKVRNRVLNARNVRASYSLNRIEKYRMPHKTAALKELAREKMKKELATFQGQTAAEDIEAHRKQLVQNLEAEDLRIEAEARKRMKQLEHEHLELIEKYCYYEGYLGVDRGFRNYWQFQSLPGLFVEHDRVFAGPCMERGTSNIPALANCDAKLRKKFITQSIMMCAGSGNILRDDVKNEMLTGNDIFEQLLIRGTSQIEANSAKKNNSFATARDREKISPFLAANSVEKDSGVDDTAPSKNNNIPVNPPTNEELFMCTGQPEKCPVHTPSHPSWGYYHTEEELDALIKSLNERGVREKRLRQLLVWEREVIVAHMKKCPLEKLSISQHENREKHVVENSRKSRKKYNDANFHHDAGTNPNEIFELKFRDLLLELEEKISAGCLGKLRVNDRNAWREAIVSRSYDSQIDGQLQWGTKRIEVVQTIINAKEMSMETDEIDEMEWRDVDVVLKDKQLFSNTTDAGNVSETNQSNDDESIAAQDSEPSPDIVRSMACALLQVQQCIDPKFFRYPFGPKMNVKVPELITTMKYEGQQRLMFWEEALMRSTSFSQLFLYYHTLYDGIQWSRSIERAYCMVCKRKANPDQLLICDECNRACHMYCLKPKLTGVPAGDWFCERCRPKSKRQAKNSNKPKRDVITSEEETEDDIELEQSESEEEIRDTKDEMKQEDDEREVDYESTATVNYDTDFATENRRSTRKRSGIININEVQSQNSPAAKHIE